MAGNGDRSMNETLEGNGLTREEATKRFQEKYGLDKLAAQWKLHAAVCTTLNDMNIHSFFPVQAAAIPKLLDESHDRICDICINAPTGSGKTLVYIVPIVQRFLTRIVCRLRALIVLPSRDLAVQVHQILSRFCHDTKLRCGLAIGQSNFAAEQASLVGDDGGSSLVDILVATPGRLVDHLEQTPGFTLQHLQFLIVDEADRLLNQSYQDWIPKMYASIFHTTQDHHDDELELHTTMTCRRQDSINRRRIRTPLTRVLLSATLTRNPRKLASIGMSNATLTKIGRMDDPLADNLQDQVESDGDDDEQDDTTSSKLYTTPTNLEEFVIECDSGSKPLVLLELLHEFKDELTIVFTASVNSTHRLARLLQLFVTQPERVREYSSSLSQKQRQHLVHDCKQGRIDVVVCSDAMARGMDIENVGNVINYDVPSFIKTYIHRVGRTARAGRHGRSVTLVKMGQMKGMLRMLKKAENNKLNPFPLQKDHMKTLVPQYTKALQLLKETLDAEKSGKLSATASIRSTKVPLATTKTKQTINESKNPVNWQQELHQSDKKRSLELLYEQLEQNLTKLQRKH